MGMRACVRRRRRKCVCFVLACCLFFTGCGAQENDFISQLVGENETPFSVSQDYSMDRMYNRLVSEKLTTSQEQGQKVSRVVRIEKIKKALEQAGYQNSEEMSMDDAVMLIWFDKRVKKLIEEESKKGTSYLQTPDGEKISFSEVDWHAGGLDEETLESEHVDTIYPMSFENIIFFYRKEGNKILGYDYMYYYSLFRDTAVEKALKEAGLTWFYDYMREVDDGNRELFYKKEMSLAELKEKMSDIIDDGENYISGFQVSVDMTSFSLVTAFDDDHAVKDEEYPEELNWLIRLRGDDAWGLAGVTHGEPSYAQLNYTVGKEVWKYQKGYTHLLKVYADTKEKKVKEVVYSDESGKKEITSYLQPTISSYLKELGMQETGIGEVIKKLPAGRKDFGNVHMFTVKENGVTYYKFYVS